MKSENVALVGLYSRQLCQKDSHGQDVDDWRQDSGNLEFSSKTGRCL